MHLTNSPESTKCDHTKVGINVTSVNSLWRYYGRRNLESKIGMNMSKLNQSCYNIANQSCYKGLHMLIFISSLLTLVNL